MKKEEEYSEAAQKYLRIHSLYEMMLMFGYPKELGEARDKNEITQDEFYDKLEKYYELGLHLNNFE